jgi:S1-C subfamily serine protease
MKTIIHRALCASLVLAAMTHTGAATAAPVPDSEERAVIPMQANESGRAVSLRTIRAKYETPPAKIGEMQSGVFCGGQRDVLWTAALFNTFFGKMSKTLRHELEQARYPLPATASDNMFDDGGQQDKPKTMELQVGAMIKEAAANYCLRSGEIQGEVYLKVFWQLYAPEAKKVLFETTTTGTFRQDKAKKGDTGSLFDQAFAMASRNLLAEQGFHDAVVNLDVPKAPEAPPLALRGPRPLAVPLAKNMESVRAAVATIKTPTGSGSGFFVSADGYLLSNQHVVGNERYVKVVLPNGFEATGEVLRKDRDRDVALIKTQSVGLLPLSLRGDEAGIGEDVYAIGSPLSERLSGSVTRGILSSYRTIADKRYIQSDVAILPGNSGGPLLDPQGNVIGIAVAGLGARGIAGLNFFIPIKDALSTLQLSLTN